VLGHTRILTFPLKATDNAFQSDGIDALSELNNRHMPQEAAPASFFELLLLAAAPPHFARKLSRSAAFLIFTAALPISPVAQLLKDAALRSP
jgi:hypothetical protein